jgi:hypothetical protein
VTVRIVVVVVVVLVVAGLVALYAGGGLGNAPVP